MKIAIISSASVQVENGIQKKIQEIVKKFSEVSNITLVTGGSFGIPGLCIQEAKRLLIPTIAYSPDKNSIEHNARFDNLDINYFNEVKYIPGFTARSLEMIHNVDGILLLNGRIGTLSEFTIALEEGKRVGVITNSGGIADHLEYILKIAQKEFPNQVFFSDDYHRVIDWIVNK